jgi:hypothetical protein
MTTIDSFTLDTFAPLIGSRFAISPEAAPAASRARSDPEAGKPPEETGVGAPVELELIEATSASGAEGATRVPFSLLFLGRSQPPLAERTYALEHAQLGSFELFIVPIAQDADGVRYEAIFN